MIFKIFRENRHYQNGQFQEKREDYIKGEYVKIWELSLVIIFVIFAQKRQFRLEMEYFEISRNSAYKNHALIRPFQTLFQLIIFGMNFAMSHYLNIT